MISSRPLLIFIGLAALSMTTVFAHPLIEARALPPALDPFYRAPAGFESAAPGTIVRQRTVQTAFLGLIAKPVEAYQLLYRTTAIDGSAIATVTTIFKPSDSKTDRFVSFQTAYDSSARICNPSYNYRLGSVQVDLISSFEQVLLQTYLLEGYIVASSDYEGPDAAFGAGRLAGMGVLDGMRAVSNFYETLGLDNDTPMIVGTGYSGGGIATGWAASLHPTYASELNVRGWSSGGTPANVTGTAVFVDDTTFSGFLPAAFAGLSKDSSYGALLDPVIARLATPYGKAQIAAASVNCAPADLLNFALMSVQDKSFQRLGDQIFYEPTVAAILEDNLMGRNANETPTAPVLLYHASRDEIIPYSNATTLYDTWCRNGADVHFTTFGNGGHLTTEILGLPMAVQFANSAFAGTLSSGCSKDTVLDDTLDPLALGASLEPALVRLINALGTLGEADEHLMGNLGLIKVPAAKGN
ncbi:uncharacterized protein LTR77_003692 [Saxophila tyrrhenica]|uniref:Triacylglycerol lipase n=1 Tax=Saxophila tyrrhenica TaxID=1690608 RepID=A0AAV9PES9_9PEZI|nr:hypothetical protein LTR77_003692 [Saxophila tyrrhenica]